MTTLFRKYRPQIFGSVVGQDTIITTLRNELALDRLGQSYLFYGPRGTGKTTTARLLAKAINCAKRSKGTYEPCETCASCQEIASGRSVDVLEIDAASQTGVDNVRENIIENAQFKPTSAKKKIFIIDEVHMLSTSAFNALLKTLEEPPLHVVFILATTELHKIPATIISRCQRFTFKKIPASLMRERLEKICTEEHLTLETEIITRIIEKSDGCLRDAESLLGQIASLAHNAQLSLSDIDLILPALPRAAAIDIIEKITRGACAEALVRIRTTIQDGISPDILMNECTDVTRLIMHANISGNFPSGEERELRPEHTEILLSISKTISAAACIRLLDLCTKRRSEIRFSPIPSLPIELLAIEYNLTPTTSTSTAPQHIAPTAPKPTPPQNAITNEKIEKQNATEQSTPITNTNTPTPPSSTNISPATLEQIKQSWKAIIDSIGKKSHSLTFVLNTTQPTNLAENILTVRVPYVLHRDKLSEQKNKKIIESAVQEIVGTHIQIECEIGTETTVQAPSLNELASAFGGEIVS